MCVQVVFRYLLSPGACPKSYGPTVARAAGVPAAVTERAVQISDSLEDGSLSGGFVSAFRQVWAGLQEGSKAPSKEEMQRLQRLAICNPT